jgi:hypothetical protein
MAHRRYDHPRPNSERGAGIALFASGILLLNESGEWRMLPFFVGVTLTALLTILVESERWHRFSSELWIRTAPREIAARLTARHLKSAAAGGGKASV